jgi:integrase
MAAKLRIEIGKGTYNEPSKMPLKMYLEQWLSGQVRTTVSPRTHELYSYLSHKFIIPAIGEIKLSQLRPQHIQKFYADMLQHVSPRTVQLYHVTLHKALSYAVKTGLMANNPCLLVETPRVERHEMKIMNEADIKKFLDEARKGDYYALFYVYLFTGLRRGEAISLRWSDIDLLGCQLSVNRTMQFIDNKVTFKQPKTNASRRQIALSPSTCVVLRLHREAQNEMRKSLNGPPVSESDLVFCQGAGAPLLPDSVTHAWRKLTKKCGLDGVRLHDARHTHASLMLKSGVSPKVIQERLGHSTFAVTMNLYAHVSPGMQQAAANRFDDVIIGNADSHNAVTIPSPSAKNDK